MRATAVVALLLHALPGAHGAATTFVRVPEDLAYAEAEARCTQIGAAIASIHSAAENALARTACGNNTCWLGLAETGGDAGTAAARLEEGFQFVGILSNWAASVCLFHALFPGVACVDAEFANSRPGGRGG